jgi:putative MATE family efflux protein
MSINRDYYKGLVTIAIPIIIQNFVSSALNAIDVIMIGQMGETSVASVGLANQITFLTNFLIFGITSGSAIFAAQLWGKRDVASIRKVLGAALIMAVGGALLFTLFGIIFPRTALSIYTNDLAVIDLGSQYLRIVAFSYPFLAISFSFGSILRSSGEVRLPVMVSVLAIILKTGLSYVLIFGKLGFPTLGIPGAALGTVIARIFETIILLSLAYRRKTVVAGRPAELFTFQPSFWNNYLKTALPVVFNEALWSLGITGYNLIYARISTEAVAAINITATIESLAFTIFIGISNACGIMVGNRIGSGNSHEAFAYARRTLVIGTLGAWLIGGLIYSLSGPVLNFYNVSPEVKEYARSVLLVISLFLWIRISNMIIIVGILRSGGDTRFGLILDVGTVWLVGIPLAAVGAFVFHLPIYWVYTLVMGDELVKLIVGYTRVFSKKWINDLTKITEPS